MKYSGKPLSRGLNTGRDRASTWVSDLLSLAFFWWTHDSHSHQKNRESELDQRWTDSNAQETTEQGTESGLRQGINPKANGVSTPTWG